MNFATKKVYEDVTSAVFRYGTLVVASRWPLQRDEDGTPVRILETNNDITERKHAQETLRGAEQLARRQLAALMRRTDKISSRMDTSDR